jgi:predicted SAM-dependent methyltransferase
VSEQVSIPQEEYERLKKLAAQHETSAQTALGAVAPALVEAAGRNLRKLDLGCGQNPKEGHEGVDLYGDGAKHKVDLFKFPWPFRDGSVDEINCSHFLEHVPAREVEERDFAPPHAGTQPPAYGYLGQDMLFAFMDECYRILKDGAFINIIVPSGRSDRAFWDPTHRRFFMMQTFLYFNYDWRKANGLTHYRVRCNFNFDVQPTFMQEEGTKSPEALQYRYTHLWNVTADWVAKLKKLPLDSPTPKEPMPKAGT